MLSTAPPSVSNLTLRSLEQRLSALLEADNFVSVRPEGPVSEAFPDTFVPSALHSHVRHAAQTGPEAGPLEHQYGCERVYRHIDEGRIGDSGYHLSSFNMLVFYHIVASEADDVSLRAGVVMRLLGLLGAFGIRPQDLLVTYFGGGCVRGQQFGADDHIAGVWRDGGLPPQKVVPLGGGVNFTNVNREGEPAGPRCEVFWCPASGTPIEIGTVVFEKFLIRDAEQGLVPSAGKVYGGALGLERLQAVLRGAATLFDLPEIHPLVARVERDIDRHLRAVQVADTRQLVDGVRTLVWLMSQIREPLSGPRAARVRRIGRRCLRSLNSLGIDEDDRLVRDLIDQAVELQDIETMAGAEHLQEAITRLVGAARA